MNLEQNYFTLLGQPQQFSVDISALKKRFRALQRQYHPDRYVGKTPQDQRLAVQFSAHLNTAFTALGNPVQRALHMLELAGIAVDHQNSTIRDSGFLMEQMEIREALDDARAEANLTALQALASDIETRYLQCQQRFADDIEAASLDSNALRDSVGKMQFFQKLADELVGIISHLN